VIIDRSVVVITAADARALSPPYCSTMAVVATADGTAVCKTMIVVEKGSTLSSRVRAQIKAGATRRRKAERTTNCQARRGERRVPGAAA
jgi:hypothetical protein